MSIRSLLDLSPHQAEAAFSQQPAIAVTAGAGSGKTRTLTARYLWLIEQGYPVRSLVAVTFTEKAAREMRNRIRGKIMEWRNHPEAGSERQLWDRAYLELDAARIGTIHSLCASVLRKHPAEADVDPMFEVLEGNTATLIQQRAIEEALIWASEDPVCSQLFGPLNENRYRDTLTQLVSNRLDARTAFQALGEDPTRHWAHWISCWFRDVLAADAWLQALSDLGEIGAHKADDKMELARRQVLAHWQRASAALQDGDLEAVLLGLKDMRQASSNYGSKGNWPGDDLSIAKEAMRGLRGYYDTNLASLLKSSRWELDQKAGDLQQGLERVFVQCLAIYEAMKAERHALDFDDLEHKTVILFRDHDQVRAHWQSESAAILVDEFQDTNHRQRQIVYALAGFDPDRGLDLATSQPDPNLPRSLFIVGDAKQSIYRFRGADVEVFRQTQRDIRGGQGKALLLDITYRAHAELVETLNELLAVVMGEEEDEQRPFFTRFEPLTAYRTATRLPLKAPWLEFHVGLGDAQEGRAAAAWGLGHRLRELHNAGCEWKEMALLFRSSTGYSYYEDAFESAGIPYVTVAGRGFYERPEIRDLLNALSAIADPTDDLAMAGLLRSPMFGLSDVALYCLRWGGERERGKLSFWDALHDGDRLSGLGMIDAEQAQRALEIVNRLHSLSGRHSVSYVLKGLVDQTGYRAALQLATGGERAWRNVHKLLGDAHTSGLVSVSDFLEYVTSMRDAITFEGEAVLEADNAVQLMTIHRSKGLEFPIVVIADAGYQGNYTYPTLLLEEEAGPLLRIGDEQDGDTRPLAYQVGVWHQRQLDQAEDKRLLYVAATRAEEKLLISGYANISKKTGLAQARGWLKELGDIVGFTDIHPSAQSQGPMIQALAWAEDGASLTLYPAEDTPAQQRTTSLNPPSLAAKAVTLSADLIKPVSTASPSEQVDKKLDVKYADPPPRVWRVVTKTGRTPNWVVGVLVHRALQYWRFPDDPDFTSFIKAFAREQGLGSEREVNTALRETDRLLRRFQHHSLYKTLSDGERYHEVAYDLQLQDKGDSGVIDILARHSPDGPWKVYDFKTDRLRNVAEMTSRIRETGYDLQLERYVLAVKELLGQEPEAHLVFLNMDKHIVIHPEL